MNRNHTSNHVAALSCSPVLLLAIFVLWFSATLQANPQSPQPGTARLDSVQVTGSTRFTSEQIASAIGLHPGQTVKRETFQDAADKLATLGLFQDIQYHFSTLGTGVNVTYQVSDAPLLAVTFDNFPWISDDELSAGMKASGILFDGTAPAKGTIIDEMSQALTHLLDARGIHAHVTHQVVTLPVKEQTVQQFRVDDADLTLQSIEFSDPLAKNDHALKERLADLVGKPYSRDAVELFEYEQVRPIYLAHSYLRVKFPPPQARLAADPSKTLSGPVIVWAAIDSGPAYQWAGVQWQGNTSITSQNLDGLVDLKPGDPADGIKIEATWDHARAAYGRAGFLDATIDPVPQFDDKTGGVIYNVTISEGRQYHMGRLVLTGLSVEGERRIRTYFPIAIGTIFDQSAYELFLSSGIKAAFAGLPVHYSKMGHFLQEDKDDAKVDVLLDFQ
jgi:outer membrane protein insertion porin family